MNINFKLTTDFERTMVALKEKYGTDFDFLNGFHDTQSALAEVLYTSIWTQISQTPTWRGIC